MPASNIYFFSFLILSTLFSGLVSADDVKRTRSGLCHDETSHSFNAIKHYDRYDSLSSCLSVPGSRLPKHMQGKSSAKSGNNYGQNTYSRDNWRHWNKGLDVNDCVNTRHETLVRQAVKGTVQMSRDGCYVSSGLWNDAYSGTMFVDPRDLDIDHIIPLYYAFKHGGAKWSKSKKELFANDPINLIAVSASLNRQKSAKGPAEWMPPKQSYRCEYVQRWKKVLYKYPSIVMPPSEQRTLGKMERACAAN